MRLTDFLLITFTVLYVNPSYSGDYGEAAENARRALLQTEFGKSSAKKLERKGRYILNDYLGMDEADLAYFIWTIPLAQGKISTRPFKKFAIKGDKWYIKPEVEYDFNGDLSTEVVLSWDF